MYLPYLFDWVIETSMMASILVGLILCVKALLRNRLSPRWHYMLWMILIVRLILPWSLDSSFSIYSILTNAYKTTVSFKSQPVSSKEYESMHETKMINTEMITTEKKPNVVVKLQPSKEGNEEIFRNEKQRDGLVSYRTIALYIWLTGVTVLGLATYFVNKRLSNYIQKQPVITDKRIVKVFEKCKMTMSVHQAIPLRQAGKISNPTVYGFLRPRVLLSKEYINQLTDQQLQHIFYHELAHIKRKDVGLNWLMRKSSNVWLLYT